MRISFYISGLTLGVIAAYLLRHYNMDQIQTTMLAAAIVFTSYALFGRANKPVPVEYGAPAKPGSRRWARILFHNKLISTEELQRFYDAHPEDEDFGEDDFGNNGA